MTHHITNAVRTALPAALALLALGSAPAHPAPRETVPRNWLYVTVTQGDAARSKETRSALLLCDPPQGHAGAARACEELSQAGGDIAGIPQKKAYCPMIHAPVTASAHGEWGGRPITYTRTFSNACLMAATTGSVFALSEPTAQEPPGPRARGALGRPTVRAQSAAGSRGRPVARSAHGA
jgi:Subtilisin inhibitor-like